VRPYDDLWTSYEEHPGETLVVVWLDLSALVLVGATVAGLALARPAVLWGVVAYGTAVVLWVLGGWSLVARWRDWD